MFALGWAVLLLAPVMHVGAGSLRRGVAAAIGVALVMGGPLIQQWAGAGALRILDNRAMHAVGRWSYSIYLFHLIVLHQLLEHVHASSPKKELALIIVPLYVGAFTLGALGFRFIERPMMRFRGFSSQPSAAPRHDPPNLEVTEGTAPVPV